jgi:hypothetical protein
MLFLMFMHIMVMMVIPMAVFVSMNMSVPMGVRVYVDYRLMVMGQPMLMRMFVVYVFRPNNLNPIFTGFSASACFAHNQFFLQRYQIQLNSILFFNFNRHYFQALSCNNIRIKGSAGRAGEYISCMGNSWKHTLHFPMASSVSILHVLPSHRCL